MIMPRGYIGTRAAEGSLLRQLGFDIGPNAWKLGSRRKTAGSTVQYMGNPAIGYLFLQVGLTIVYIHLA